MTRIVRFSLHKDLPPTAPDNAEVRYGQLEGEEIHERTPGGFVHKLADVRLLPPCAPTKIVCVGRNYAEHARELGNEVPAEPLIFLKPPSSLLASGDEIVYPRLSQRVDFEGELGVVIGRQARRVSRADALEHVLGYTVVNDVTARDLQKKDGQWTRGKGFDTFCPVGPWMVPVNGVDLSSLRVRTRLDGVVKQDAPVTDMIFPVADIITYVTQFLTLEPGDLIATGTPPGVAPMQPGSLVEVEIEGIGVLRNSVVPESES
jgi:2-keto-4-pentenoate hydratase/2-oxohepta-3-ene-1,7-dioic acid hydratase in catechol pathway